MREFKYTKIMAIVLCILTIISVMGVGLLFWLGSSLGKALSGEAGTSTVDPMILFAIAGLLGMAVLTGLGARGLKRTAWRNFYLGFTLLVGIGFLFLFILSLGALSRPIEFLILCMCMGYFLLGYLTKKKL